MRRRDGQASVLLVAALAAVLVGVVVLGSAARGVAREAAAQRAADLAALAGARAMHAATPRLFEPPEIDGRPNPRHLDRAAFLDLAREAAVGVAEANGAESPAVRFPDGDSFAPMRIRVGVRAVVEVRRNDARRRTAVAVAAEAEIAPTLLDPAAGGGYDGPLAYRQGKPMRPDVAQAFDRMERAARADGVSLLITSGYRSDAEQAELFRRRPDPRWVAPPGRSLHRLATELDLGPQAAYGWLASNAGRFHFTQRYAWERSELRTASIHEAAVPEAPRHRAARARSGGRPRSAAPARSGRFSPDDRLGVRVQLHSWWTSNASKLVTSTRFTSSTPWAFSAWPRIASRRLSAKSSRASRGAEAGMLSRASWVAWSRVLASARSRRASATKSSARSAFGSSLATMSR